MPARENYGELADQFLTLYPGNSDVEVATSQMTSTDDSLAWIHDAWVAAHTKTGHAAYL
jgi:hypothetical protein